MILIVRMLTDGEAQKMWAAIIDQKDSLQSTLGKKGRLLYLTKRVGVNEASLFVHANDLNAVIDLIISRLGKIEAISAISIINLFRPRFFPVPKDTSDKKRFVITVKADPKLYSEVYKKLLNPNLPEGLRRVYYAFTFQHYEDDLQYSLLADDEERVQKFVAENINTINGIIKTEVHLIEKTKAFISYKEWIEYTSESNSVPAWHRYMEHHFED